MSNPACKNLSVICVVAAAALAQHAPRATAADPAGRWFTLRDMRAGVAVLDIDLAGIARAGENAPALTVRDFPLDGDRRVDLELAPFRVTRSDTLFVVGRPAGPDRPAAYDPTRIILLAGRIAGSPDSDVFLAFGDRFAAGYIDPGGGGPRNAVSSRDAQGRPLPPGRIAVFRPTPGAGGIPGVPPCGTDTSHQTIAVAHTPTEAGTLASPTLNMIEMAVDTDYDFFELFGDVDRANDYVVALYAAVSHIYARDTNARLQLTFVRLWDDPDDLYNQDDPFFPFIAHWENFMGAVHRDVAQLLTGRRNLPYGGVAFLGALCGDSAYSVAGFILGSFPTPDRPGTGNWDMVVTSHELGHNCGAPHTHSYTPPIDECAFGEITRSSIMSYCHIQPGGVANIDLNFHTSNQDAMKQFLAASSCIGRDCNANGVDDAVDLQLGSSADTNADGIPDECQDCNDNGILDPSDVAAGAPDVNANGVPDVCETDCNGNSQPDPFDIAMGASDDLNGNNIPDECEPDCDGNAQADHLQVAADMILDIDRNVVLDDCQDCDADGVTDFDALTGAHNLWVAAGGRIAEFHAASGVIMHTSTPASASGALDLVISDTGRIFVSLAAADRIREFDRTGALIGDFVTPAGGGLDEPAGMTFAAHGNLLVCSRGNDSVLEFDGQSGEFVRTAVQSGAGGLSAPQDLVVGPDGNLYVTNRDTDRVTVYNGQTGDSLGDFFAPGTTLPDMIAGLVFKPDGRLLVASHTDDAVFEYDGQTGEYLRQFTRGGSPTGFWGLDGPYALRIGPDGNLFVSSQAGNVLVHMYDGDNGLFLRSFYILPQAGLSAPTGFDFMPGDAVDCNLNLLPDACDIASGASTDINHNARPDECESLGDTDADGDVDLLDVTHFFDCVTGPAGGVPAGCTPSDIDADDDVDFADYGLLMTVFD